MWVEVHSHNAGELDRPWRRIESKGTLPTIDIFVFAGSERGVTLAFWRERTREALKISHKQAIGGIIKRIC